MRAGTTAVRMRMALWVGLFLALAGLSQAVPAAEQTVLLPGGVPLMMVWIPGGSYLMGRYAGEQDSNSTGDPQHWVTLGGFWMAKYELTKRQWTAVMGTKPWLYGGSSVLADPDSPAMHVSWNNAQSFLTAMNSYTGKNFRLPSEAQWEYACRGGTRTRFYWGDDLDGTAIGIYGWYWGNCSYQQQYAHVVGQKLPNAFGLYDMSGNVDEWCEDDWHGNYTGAPSDGGAWVDSPRGISRVYRGGDFGGLTSSCRSAVRYDNTPVTYSDGIGFRLALNAADLTAPSGTIAINNNRSATNTRNVTLSLTWDDGTDGSGMVRMRFSDDGAHWSVWEPVAATRAYTLPPGPDGHRTVRVQYLDKANNRSLVYSDYILLDTTPPTGAIFINSGAATTVTQLVSLGLIWSDGSGAGVSRIRFSDNGSNWTAWMPFETTHAHTLPAGLGYHTVRVQYLDGAGNYSAVYNDYIKLVEASLGTTETVMLPGDVPLIMVWIPGGAFIMGRSPGEGSSSYEVPQHAVAIAGYWMAKYELTKRQWTAAMGTTPWAGISNVLADLDSPAECVSWNDAQSLLTALNSYSGKTFRLPSESEWEYACRAGSATRFYWGDDPEYTAIGDYAWYYDNAYNVAGQQYAHVVGQKLPNAFGLYDMSGNVLEWCEDDWFGSYTGAPTGGQAWVNNPRSEYRVIRGGSVFASPGGYSCRSACRTFRYPNTVVVGYGFRVARTP